jgi:hypothetical protein
MNPDLDQMQAYKRNWLQHCVKGMPHDRLPRAIKTAFQQADHLRDF